MRDTVSEIKDRLSILDVVGSHVKLRRAGKSYVGLCPFHKEKTASFHVNPERGSFHCFGCGEGGDMFTFTEKVEGVDFRGALKILAEKAGVEIEYESNMREARDKQERLREAVLRASEFYRAKLAPDSPALSYARSRGLHPDTIDSWSLGAAPAEWRILLEDLTAKGFAIEELAAAGLIKEADGKPGTYYDRFRDRLMFPIRDIAGRTVGFTGRALSPDEQAKYLNSPETDLYHKSDVLFGMDKAKDAIRTRGFALLVEGQMDLLHAHQAGFTNTIALSGTALTARHVALIMRYSPNLMLALDADAAGLAATFKSARLALSEGMSVKAVRLPQDKDPADLISEDPKAFTESLRDAKPVAEFFLATLASKERDQHRLVTQAEKIVLPLIAAVKSPLERSHFVGITARALGLSPESVAESVKRVPQGEPSAIAVPSTHKQQENRAPAASARDTRDLALRALVVGYPATPLAERVKNEYARIVDAPLDPEGVPEPAIFAVLRDFGETPTEDAADDLLNAFEAAVVREAYQTSVVELRRAEAANDPERVKEAEAACKKFSTRLAKLTH